MQGKDYNVSFIDNLTTYQAAVNRISEIQGLLQTISTDLQNLVDSDSFTGAAADNIKAYISEIHLLLISSVSSMLTEYQCKLLMYYTGYFDIDDSYATKFCAETMELYRSKAIKYDTANQEVSDQIATALNKVSDIISLANPSKEALTTNLQWMVDKIDTLDQSIVDYEDTHSTDLDSLNDFINNLETFITFYKENVNPGDYHSGDCASNMYAYELYQSMLASQAFVQGNEAKINSASDKIAAVGAEMQADYEAACKAREDQGRAEMIKGIAIGVVGAIAIFASAGAATPLVAGALFVTGSCAYAYGASNFCEGLEDYEYGKAGDLTSYAFNPIRDTVFMGNQQLYDLWGNVNVMAAGFLTMGAGAYAEGVASGYTGFELTKSVSIAVAKETVVGFLGDKATEATVSMLDQHFNLNMTEEALLEIGLSVAFDPGTYETAHGFYNKATGKLHPDIHTDISDVAGQTLLPDSELNFADMMSPEDAARYNQWSADCANGTHNNFPGLKDADVAAWKFGDAKLADASVMAGIDGEALLALRRENVKVDFTSGTLVTPEISSHVIGADDLSSMTHVESSVNDVFKGRKVTGDCDWFDNPAEIENGGAAAKLRYERWEQTRMEGIDLKDINDFITAKNRPTKAEFEAMKNTPVGTLSPEQFRHMKIIRESIPGMDDTITIRKVVKWDDIDNYLNQDWLITGYVAKADDVKPFITYGEVRDALRLDYTYMDNGKLVIPYPEGGDAYGYIDFTISKDDFIDIPYGDAYGGAYHNGQPYSGNGFLLSKQDVDIPESIINKDIYPNGLKPQQGEIHLVVGKEDVIVGDWSRRDNGWMYHSN